MDTPPTHFIVSTYEEPLAATVDAWLDPAIERDPAAVEAFLLAAQDLGPIWGSFGTGVPLPGGRCISYTFAPDHVPEGLEVVRDWLRAQSVVRLIEVVRYHPPVT
jgi:hypothetical protein